MTGMTSLDWVIVAILAVSCLLGIWRGLIREVFSVAGWVAAVLLSLHYADALGALLPGDIAWPALRTWIGVAIIVVVCLFSAALLGFLVHRLIAAVRLTGTDRMLGAVFGLLRGVLIIFAAVYFTSRTALAQQPAWRNAVLVQPFDAGVRWLAPHLPALFSAPKTT
jgi:membrane protein required for colicin V production